MKKKQTSFIIARMLPVLALLCFTALIGVTLVPVDFVQAAGPTNPVDPVMTTNNGMLASPPNFFSTNHVLTSSSPVAATNIVGTVTNAINSPSITGTNATLSGTVSATTVSVGNITGTVSTISGTSTAADFVDGSANSFESLFSGSGGNVLMAAEDSLGNYFPTAYAQTGGNYPSMNVGGASFADSAGSAGSASFASSASSADFATTAGSATNDSSGNPINTTYAAVGSNATFNSVITGVINDSGGLFSIDTSSRNFIGADGSTIILSWPDAPTAAASIKALVGVQTVTGTLSSGTASVTVPSGIVPWVQSNASSITHQGNLAVTVSGTTATVKSSDSADAAPFHLFYWK
jgi:hypothetical protein